MGKGIHNEGGKIAGQGGYDLLENPRRVPFAAAGKGAPEKAQIIPVVIVIGNNRMGKGEK
jgi:hypothetical protein